MCNQDNTSFPLDKWIELPGMRQLAELNNEWCALRAEAKKTAKESLELERRVTDQIEANRAAMRKLINDHCEQKKKNEKEDESCAGQS